MSKNQRRPVGASAYRAGVEHGEPSAVSSDSLDRLVALNAGTQPRDPRTKRWVSAPDSDLAWEPSAAPTLTTGASSGPLLGLVIETPGHRPARNVETTAGTARTHQSLSKLIVTEETVDRQGNHLLAGYMASSSGSARYRVTRHTVGHNQPVVIHGRAVSRPRPTPPSTSQGSLF